MKFLNWFKGHRTRVFGVLVAILGVVEINSAVIPDDYRGYIMMATGILIIILRQITTTPPGKSE